MNLKKRAPNDVRDFDLMAKAVQMYSGTKEDLGLVESLLGRVRPLSHFLARESL